MNPKIAIIDYEMGNLRSVEKAIEKVGGRATVTSDPRVVRKASGVVLPGVGAFGEAARRLRALGLWSVLQEVLGADKPFLGICLGLQLLFEDSAESPGLKGLGRFKGSVVRFPKSTAAKIPHMGWNTLQTRRPARGPCLAGVRSREYFYFVHSYYPAPQDRRHVAATTEYAGRRFCSAVADGHLFASQFHPEKSGSQGLRILKNFVAQVDRC